MLLSCCCQLCHQLSSLSVLSRGDSKEWNQEEGLPGSLDELRWLLPIFLNLSCILETLISSRATLGEMETSRQEKDRIDDLCLFTVCQGVQDCSRSFGVLWKQENFRFRWGHNSISAKISQELQYNPVKLMLTLIVLELPPHVAFTNNEANIQFQIFQHCLAPFQSDIYTSEMSLANNPFKSGAAWWSAQSETSLATNPFKSGDAWWSAQ